LNAAPAGARVVMLVSGWLAVLDGEELCAADGRRRQRPPA